MTIAIKCLRLCSATSLLLSLTAFPVQASPVSGKLGLTSFPPLNVGVDAELSPAESPLRFGLAAAYFPGVLMNSGGIDYSAYAHYAFPVPGNVSLGPMIGVRQDWSRPGFRLPFTPNPVGTLMGVSAQYETGPIWVRVSPHAIVALGAKGVSSVSYLEMLGIPWLEAGARLSHGLELSVRANALPIKLSLTF